MAREQDYRGQIENLKQISSLNAEILASEKIIEKTSGAVKKNQIEKAKALRAALKATKQQKIGRNGLEQCIRYPIPPIAILLR